MNNTPTNLRGDKKEVPGVTGLDSAVIIHQSKRPSLVAANIINPIDGSVQFHVVSTKIFNIAIVGIITLLLGAVVILALIIYLKSDIDQNKQQLEQIKQEGPKDVTNTP